ncbi:hypothetical protein EBB79_10425 [Parasedimentitalea marina]|uniref:Uncharacterized protein n=1 Tax=Parasedimentitalea marina TaxID=2483033 RepID=A0A3T0N2M9_9RHOB|nr:iron chelate uptake ABC transporter family permease subunit [Parasedimentitalea marina]AZV78251.1 hypothetical protein EBB79_10425 [Parasedimentitalea marina]
MERGEWLKRFAFATSIFALLFVGGTAASLATGGRNDVGLNALLGVFRAEPATFAQSIMFDIRLPRTVAVILTGMNLAITGLVFAGNHKKPIGITLNFWRQSRCCLGNGFDSIFFHNA